MGICIERGATLSWVALPGVVAGLLVLGCFAASEPSHAAPGFPGLNAPAAAASSGFPSKLQHINVTPGPLAMLGPGEMVPQSGEETVAERAPSDPTMPPHGPVNPAPPMLGDPFADGAPPTAGAPPAPGAVPGMDAEALFADPQARAQMLDQLYAALGASPDADAAARVQSAIENVWMKSGSPTIDVLLERAMRLGQEGDYELSLEILNAAVSLSPDTAEIWHQRAMVQFVLGEDASALADLRRALALDPQHYEAINGLGRVLEHLGRKEAALAVFRRALKVNPYLKPAQSAVEELSREIEGQDI